MSGTVFVTRADGTRDEFHDTSETRKASSTSKAKFSRTYRWQVGPIGELDIIEERVITASFLKTTTEEVRVVTYAPSAWTDVRLAPHKLWTFGIWDVE